MSPEVFGGKKSDGRADMYSLALVMYKLLNNDRLPFLDPNKQIVRYSERQAAFEKRIKGEELPVINGASKELNAVILKACSFKNTDRQKNIDEFRSQLEKLSVGKKTINRGIVKFIIAAVIVAVCGSLFAAAMYKTNESFKNFVDGSKVDEVQQEEVEPERKYNHIATVNLPGSGLYEYNNVDGKYMIVSLDDEYNCEPPFLIDMKDNCVINIYEEAGLDSKKSYVYMFDGKSYYYVEDKDNHNSYGDQIGYSVYRYDITTKEKTEVLSSEKNILYNLVYADDEYLYIVDNDNTSDEMFGLMPANFKRFDFSTKEMVTLAYDVYTPINYNGYLIFSADVNGCYTLAPLWVYDTETQKLNLISEEALTVDVLYFKDDEVYFRETYATENSTEPLDYNGGNIQISKYNLSTEKKEMVSNLNESGLEFDAESGAAYAFNEEFAVLNGVEDEFLYIWSYKDKTCKKIELPENMEYPYFGYSNSFVTDKTISDNMLFIHEESYGYKLYEVLSNGSLKQVGNDVFIEETNVFSFGSKIIAYNKESNTVKIYNFFEGESTEKAEYVECNEIVYATENVNIRIGPDSKYKSLGILPKGESIERIATGSNDWSKVVYEDKVVYISSKFLETLTATNDDFESLIGAVDAMAYCFYVDEFDAESDDAFDDAMRYILDSTFGVYEYYNDYFSWNKKHERFYQDYNSDEDAYIAKDPLKKFDTSYAYAKFPADKVEWILENVYNQTPYRDFSRSWCYYYNGYYYAETGDGGDAGYQSVIENYEKTDDGAYIFEVRTNYYDTNNVASRYKVTAKIKSLKGKKYWVIEKFVFNPSKEALLYREFLESEYSFENNEEYCVYDMNNDGQKEIIICNYSEDETKKHDVYTVVNTKVEYVGSFNLEGRSLYESHLYTLCYSEDYDDIIYYNSEMTEVKATMISVNDDKIEKNEHIFEAETFSAKTIELAYVSDFSLLRY